MPHVEEDPNFVYDVIGIGFGPANLAIAGAILEKRDNTPSTQDAGGKRLSKVLFVEKNLGFRWHPGMLLPNTRMQISFLKDLATLRSPQSPLTFLSYLHSQDRLLSFINRGSFTPTRKEFSDYLSWAANYVETNGIDVRYGEEVVGILEGDGGSLVVVSRNPADGKEHMRKTKSLIISPGGAAKIPPVFTVVIPHSRVIHSSVYASSIDTILSSINQRSPSDRPLRIGVIGSGQSAAEVLLDLYNRLGTQGEREGRKYQVDLVFRNGSFKPSDDTPFSNEVFDPTSTDFMFNLPQRARHDVLKEYHHTNYSVVNPRTIDALYEVFYDQKLDQSMARRSQKDSENRVRLNLIPHTRIVSVDDTTVGSNSDNTSADPKRSPEGSSIHLVLQHTLTHELSEQTYDAIICGTGYDRSSWIRLLESSEIGKYFGFNAAASTVDLVPSVSGPKTELIDQTAGLHVEGLAAYTATSGNSTPLTSPGHSPSLSSSQLLTPPRSTKLHISRNYRLLPVTSSDSGASFLPRIYLQGCTESTHGLSESLLSILGVRAGLVVDDILS